MEFSHPQPSGKQRASLAERRGVAPLQELSILPDGTVYRPINTQSTPTKGTSNTQSTPTSTKGRSNILISISSPPRTRVYLSTDLVTNYSF